MSAEMQNCYKNYVNQIENYLDGFFHSDVPWRTLHEAMRYALLGGGKRIRAVLVLEFCRISGGKPESALPFAAAIEMIHAYSLAHDDLPAMDDDILRRGKPTCHIQFDEATAILAGDALQSAAFRTVLSANLPETARMHAGLTLANAAGEYGMVAGQILDLAGERRALSAAELMNVHSLKTAALMQAAAKLGVLAGGGTEAQIRMADAYAYALGLAFQIRDDILDYEGCEDTLGKPIGSDNAQGKTTIVTLHSIKHAKKLLREYTENAKKALQMEFEESDFLLWLADWLLARKV